MSNQDLVRRLRQHADWQVEQCNDHAADAFNEAAAEIERLRAKVAGLAAGASIALPYIEGSPYEGSLAVCEQLEQAIYDADVECVRGWWQDWRGSDTEVHGWVHHNQASGDMPPCTVVIHKEQP